MTKNKAEIIAESDELKRASDTLSKVSAISAIANMEGGKILVSSLLKDVVGVISTLRIKYKELTLQELMGLCASLDEKLNVAEVISGSNKTKDALAQELDEALSKKLLEIEE